LEDRLVKHFMKTGNAAGEPESDFYGNIYRPFQFVAKKALEPGAAEIAQNPRSRSAKLRTAVK
jgi:16S rRNA (cytosine1402-N4)-methyltransferase